MESTDVDLKLITAICLWQHALTSRFAPLLYSALAQATLPPKESRYLRKTEAYLISAHQPRLMHQNLTKHGLFV